MERKPHLDPKRCRELMSKGLIRCIATYAGADDWLYSIVAYFSGRKADNTIFYLELEQLFAYSPKKLLMPSSPFSERLMDMGGTSGIREGIDIYRLLSSWQTTPLWLRNEQVVVCATTPDKNLLLVSPTSCTLLLNRLLERIFVRIEEEKRIGNVEKLTYLTHAYIYLSQIIILLSGKQFGGIPFLT